MSLVGGSGRRSAPSPSTCPPRCSPLSGVRARISTLDLAIGGGAGYPRTDADRSRWLEAHRGAHRPRSPIACWSATAPTRRDARNAAGQPAHPSSTPRLLAEEIAFLAEREEVVTLIDLLLRRTSIAFVGGVTAETLAEVAEAAAPFSDGMPIPLVPRSTTRPACSRSGTASTSSHLAPLSA
jgi:glycerol-3-phosphate dehydrogenase